jgi:hypothetical protein
VLRRAVQPVYDALTRDFETSAFIAQIEKMREPRLLRRIG